MLKAIPASALALAGTCIALGDATGPSTAQTPYMVSVDPSVGTNIISIASNGDDVIAPAEFFMRLNTGAMDYQLMGLPDGTGAFQTQQDVADGTLSFLVNHEFNSNIGIVRDHGSRGASVSLWKIKNDPAAEDFLTVVGAQDLIQNVYIYNRSTLAYELYNAGNPMLNYDSGSEVYGGDNPDNNGFGRFCSADLPAPGAFAFNGLGTDERIFMNGEEIGAGGRAFAHIVTGPNAGTSYELPWLGRCSWENSVASPFPQDKTIVVGCDDATPGNIFFYVGTKTDSGTEVDRAGLTNGTLYTVGVTGDVTPIKNPSGQNLESQQFGLGLDGKGEGVFSAGFELISLGNASKLTGAEIQEAGDNMEQMNFLRPEDGAWNPSNPNQFVIGTTDSFNGNSRLWSFEFTDITNPELGGTLTMLIDGSNPDSVDIVAADGTDDVRMIDNICFNSKNEIMVQEDTGGNARQTKMWLYDIALDRITLLGNADPDRFVAGGANFLTTNEEASGVIDASDVIGPNWYLFNLQANGVGYGGELDRGGQLMAAFQPPLCTGDLTGDNATNSDDLNVLLAAFGATNVADLNGDGVTDSTDLNILLAAFGDPCN